MARLILENVNVDIPIPSLRARSLRTVAIARARAIGGQIINSGTDISVMRALENVSFSLKDGDRLGLVGTLVFEVGDAVGVVVRLGQLVEPGAPGLRYGDMASPINSW